MVDPFPESDEHVFERVITTSPETIGIESLGNERASPTIVLTNVGQITIRRFKISNEYRLE